MKDIQKGFILPLIIIIVAALSISGGVYYAKKAKSEPQTQTIATSTSTPSSSTSVTASSTVSTGLQSGTLRSLLLLNKDLVCTFHSTSSEESVKGKVYISGTMMRADTSVTTEKNGTVEAHMIRKGDDVYAWTGKQGVKLKLTAAEGYKSSSTMSLDEKIEYSCTSWVKDESVFTLPASSTTTFIDVAAFLKHD